MKKRKKSIMITALAVITFCFCYYQNNRLTVTYYSYENEKISSVWDGYRILQISDLHNKEFGENNQRLIGEIQELKPDMILLTGDLVDSSHTDLKVASVFAEQVVDICPTYYVTGNHECWLNTNDKKKLLDELNCLGVKCLQNEVSIVEQGNSQLFLLGLNDENLTDHTLKDRVGNLQKDKLTIVLAHEPQFFESYCEAGVDLVFSGHAHGGQFRLPFWGGLVAPDQGMFPEYTEGQHKSGNTTMIISRGLGNSVIPLRIFNLPEIVCVDLQSNIKK